MKLFFSNVQLTTAWDQAPQWVKGKKLGEIGKIYIPYGERNEPSSGLGSGNRRPPFPLPRLPLSSLRSPNFFPRTPIFFSFFPQFGPWSQAKFANLNSQCLIICQLFVLVLQTNSMSCWFLLSVIATERKKSLSIIDIPVAFLNIFYFWRTRDLNKRRLAMENEKSKAHVVFPFPCPAWPRHQKKNFFWGRGDVCTQANPDLLTNLTNVRSMRMPLWLQPWPSKVINMSVGLNNAILLFIIYILRNTHQKAMS